MIKITKQPALLVKEWKNEPSLTDMDISKLSKTERKELSEKLDDLEALALKAKEMLNG